MQDLISEIHTAASPVWITVYLAITFSDKSQPHSAFSNWITPKHVFTVTIIGMCKSHAQPYTDCQLPNHKTESVNLLYKFLIIINTWHKSKLTYDRLSTVFFPLYTITIVYTTFENSTGYLPAVVCTDELASCHLLWVAVIVGLPWKASPSKRLRSTQVQIRWTLTPDLKKLNVKTIYFHKSIITVWPNVETRQMQPAFFKKIKMPFTALKRSSLMLAYLALALRWRPSVVYMFPPSFVLCC